MTEPTNKRLLLRAARNLALLFVVAFVAIAASNYVSALLGWCHT